MTVKSNDLISLTFREKHSKPYNKIGRHLLFTSSSMTSSDSEAVLPIFLKMALIDGYPWHQLQVRRRPVKVRWSETDVLPLSYTANQSIYVSIDV